MRLHVLQHVPFEGPARIEAWARARAWDVAVTRLFEEAPLPGLDDLDWLVVMGGPMSVRDEKRHAFLAPEKAFIREAVEAKRTVLGVCLGAQLIAEVLGAKVRRNPEREIGWHPVRLTPEARHSPVFHTLPGYFTPLHWHGETFDTPRGATRMAESDACANQAFEYDGGRVVGLQFHLEASPESLRDLVTHCVGDLTEDTWVQPAEKILSDTRHLRESTRLLTLFLENLDRATNPRPAPAECD